MKDISLLKSLTTKSTVLQLRVMLLTLSAASAGAAYYYGVPWLMVAFVGGFWLLPFFGMDFMLSQLRMATEAYDGNHSVGVQVKWIENDESESTTYSAELDLGAEGKWLLHLGGSERPFEWKKRGLPAVVTVWIHPQSKEPCLLKSETGYFYAKKIERLIK